MCRLYDLAQLYSALLHETADQGDLELYRQLFYFAELFASITFSSWPGFSLSLSFATLTRTDALKFSQ
jgi:hypothetical protein